MKPEFAELFNSYKNLNDSEKKRAIIEFLENDILTMQNMNKEINNNLSTQDLNAIINADFEDKLDIIYKLLHVLTEQIELFSDKISQDFYE